MIGNKITDKITSVSKKKPDKELHNDEREDVEIATPKKKYISPEERKQTIEELRLVPKRYVMNSDTYLPNKDNKLLIN